MLIPRFNVWMFPVGMMAFGAGVVSGQNYPNKPIRMVAGEIGGANDLAARVVAQGLTGSLGQQVIVDNRGGGGGIIAGEIVLKAPPDGYTLLFFGSSIWALPLMRDNAPWDPLRDFAPLTLAVTSPNILVVHPSVPADSVKELIALAKARPGDLNYGRANVGSPVHLATELFKSMTGVNIVSIPFKGGGPALIGLVGGQVQLMFTPSGSGMPHVKSGRLRALAVTSAEPSALVPGLPTVAATVPGYESVAMFGIFAPARTPATLINRLNQEIVRILDKADVKEKFLNGGVETVGSSPKEFADTIRSEMAKWGKVIKDAGIRAE